MNGVPQQQTCPSTKQLQDWLSGNIESSSEVQEHLASCDKCVRVLDALSDDSELLAFAAGSSNLPNVYSREPEFESLRKALSSLNALDTNDSAQAAKIVLASGLDSTERAEVEATDPTVTSLRAPSIEQLRSGLPDGRFLVDRLIATGGSGAVYLAYDQRLQREVAIKVLGRSSTRDRQRFLREARLLAELEHPNVVRVLDFGKLTVTQDSLLAHEIGPDQLYLVMEYIAGGTAANLQFDQAGWRGVDSPDVGTKSAALYEGESRIDQSPIQRSMSFQRLSSMLATAADGLAAAHAKSLVHRDIKPGNLLLVVDWSAMKVADFGLARTADVDRTQVTRTGDLLGTPVFMSPEQVSGQPVSASSDIYSFGATLFQLLTGEPPFQGNSAAILRQIVEVPPVTPRLLNPQIPVDLEVICLHAMEKEPSARYASMEQFAGDLRRFAAGEPILAKPISATQKAVRFLRKNSAFAGALLAISVLLLTLTSGSVLVAILISNQNARLSASAKAENQAKLAAQKSLRDSIAAADELLVSVTEDTDLLPRTPGSEEVARKLLKKAQRYYQQLLTVENHNDPLIRFDEARARSGLAQVANRLGNPPGVVEEASAAIALLNEIPADAIDSVEKAELIAKTLGYLGKSLSTQGELKRAAEVMEQAVATCEAELKLQEQSDSTDSDDGRKLRFLLGDSLRLRAVAENMAGELDQAELTLNQAEAIFAALLQSSPNDAKYLRMLAGCHSTMAVTLVRRDGYQAAKQHLEAAVEILSKLEVDGQLPVRVRPDRATNYVNLASVEFHLGNIEKARDLFIMADSEYAQLAVLEPGVVDHRYKRVLTVMNSGKVDFATNNIQSILDRYLLIEPVLADLLEVDPDSQEYLGTLGMVQGNIAIFLRRLGRTEEALEKLKISDTTLNRYAQLIENTPDSLYSIALNQYELSKCCLKLNRIAEGRAAIAKSMAMTESLLKDHPDYLPSRTHQVDELVALCDLLEASADSDPAELMQTVHAGFATAEKLLAEIPDLPDYQVAYGVLFASLSESHLRQKQLEQAVAAAFDGVNHLQALNADAESENVREAFQGNYSALAKALAAQLESLDRQDPTRNDIKDQLQRALEMCSQFGVESEVLNAARASLKDN